MYRRFRYPISITITLFIVGICILFITHFESNNREEISDTSFHRQLSIFDSILGSQQAKDNTELDHDHHDETIRNEMMSFRSPRARRPGDGMVKRAKLGPTTNPQMDSRISSFRPSPEEDDFTRAKVKRRKSLYPRKGGGGGGAPEEQDLGTYGSVNDTFVYTAEIKKWCTETKTLYNVIPLESYGTLPAAMKPKWHASRCGALFVNEKILGRSVTKCINPELHYEESIHTTNFPLIAIMAATTTRNIRRVSLNQIALFKFMLPSLVRSVDCGFRYIYTMGYDAGDTFYDNDANMKKVIEWFETNVEKPLKQNGIMLKLEPVRVVNILKKPGPVFLEMARKAYALGADYYYRINDDTEFEKHWPRAYVNGIQSLSKPYGIIGPSSSGTKNRILTHDFVHRTHMQIFEMNYYPPELSDWWMDDWITVVYGQSRTFMSREITVKHHTGAHGQRYKVDKTHMKQLVPLITTGRQLIRKWMLIHNVDKNILKNFDSDVSTIGMTLNELPRFENSIIKNTSYWCTSEEIKSGKCITTAIPVVVKKKPSGSSFF